MIKTKVSAAALYPYLTKLGVPVVETDSFTYVDTKLVHEALEKKVVGASDQFSALFGVQTCPVVTGVRCAVYAWDAEAVVHRIATGERTGTQLFWD